MPDNLKPLLYWVKEREAIRIRKQRRDDAENDTDVANDNPLTKDPILATYRFCNVRRREDRVSHWLRDHVLTIGNLEDWGFENFLMFSALCRWCNWPPTIRAIMEAGLIGPGVTNWKEIGKLIDRRGKTEKVWTGAYMIRAPKTKGGKKGKFVAEQVIGKHFKALIPRLAAVLGQEVGQASYQHIHALLCTAPNFGSFMSGQIAGDWTYTPLLSQAADLKTWAPMGPGSVRGFNRIMQNPGKLSKRPSEALWLEKLVSWRFAIVKKLGPDYEDITALDVQNCLCETDKFLRVTNGEGRPRAKYSAHNY